MRRALARALAALAFAVPAVVPAAEARPVADDPALEARVTSLAAELRCLVCQNQTLADSHAPLAIDLRNQVRDLLAAGRSEREVVDYLVARYGDFVLYRPPFKATTLFLWAGPALILGLALLLAARYMRAHAAPRAPDALAARRADALLGLDGEGRAP